MNAGCLPLLLARLLEKMILRDQRDHAVGEGPAEWTQKLGLLDIKICWVSGTVPSPLRLGHIVEILLPAGGVHHVPAGRCVGGRAQGGGEEGEYGGGGRRGSSCSVP